MDEHAHWMRRCLQLALKGAGAVAPNPMVGAVLVRNGEVLAEGWHRLHGGPHAEVECLRSFGTSPVPQDAVMYVNLEPCSHHGKTPPCVDLLIERGIKHLVIGCSDPNPLVQGHGIARAKAAGIAVVVDVLRDECRWVNRRFMTSMELQRPYVILKWARSADGFLDEHGRTRRISSPPTDVLVHRWRAEEQAILVGSRTVTNDDPSLNVRLMQGRDPVRVVIDRTGSVPATSKVFDGSRATLLFTTALRDDIRVDQHVLTSGDPIDGMLAELHRRQIRSVLVEGGAELLGHFLRRGIWDEARVITGTMHLVGGTVAPVIDKRPARTIMNGADRIEFVTNDLDPDNAWCW